MQTLKGVTEPVICVVPSRSVERPSAERGTQFTFAPCSRGSHPCLWSYHPFEVLPVFLLVMCALTYPHFFNVTSLHLHENKP